jgi:hypothetical protein
MYSPETGINVACSREIIDSPRAACGGCIGYEWRDG